MLLRFLYQGDNLTIHSMANQAHFSHQSLEFSLAAAVGRSYYKLNRSWRPLSEKRFPFPTPHYPSITIDPSALYTLLEIGSSTANYYTYKSHSKKPAWKLILRRLNQTVEKRTKFRTETSQSANEVSSFLRGLQHLALNVLITIVRILQIFFWEIIQVIE